MDHGTVPRAPQYIDGPQWANEQVPLDPQLRGKKGWHTAAGQGKAPWIALQLKACKCNLLLSPVLPAETAHSCCYTQAPLPILVLQEHFLADHRHELLAKGQDQSSAGALYGPSSVCYPVTLGKTTLITLHLNFLRDGPHSRTHQASLSSVTGKEVPGLTSDTSELSSVAYQFLRVVCRC